MGALHQFAAQIVGRPDGDIDVTQAAALLALHADPGIDVEESILAPLRRLASDFSVRAARTHEATRLGWSSLRFHVQCRFRWMRSRRLLPGRQFSDGSGARAASRYSNKPLSCLPRGWSWRRFDFTWYELPWAFFACVWN